MHIYDDISVQYYGYSWLGIVICIHHMRMPFSHVPMIQIKVFSWYDSELLYENIKNDLNVIVLNS